MGQNSCVSAFRSRCSHAGYRDISIKRQPSGNYFVSARDPLFGELYFGIFSEYELSKFFRGSVTSV